jgi:hypothetical protein
MRLGQNILRATYIGGCPSVVEHDLIDIIRWGGRLPWALGPIVTPVTLGLLLQFTEISDLIIGYLRAHEQDNSRKTNPSDTKTLLFVSEK